MKTSGIHLLALALANATVLTEAFSIRQIFRVAGSGRPSTRTGSPSSSSMQREAALVVDTSSSSSSSALSPDLALFDEPRRFRQQLRSDATTLLQQDDAALPPRPALAVPRPSLLPRPWKDAKLPSLNRRLELPRHVEPDLAKAKLVMSLEMLLGRAAMVASVVLFVVEVTTGQSLPDQLSTLL